MRFGQQVKLLVVGATLATIGCWPQVDRTDVNLPANGPGEVIVYTSVDDLFARPICNEFERKTGIIVQLVPDTEETKSTGLLNRLLAEKARPRCDVFWNGDPIRAAIFKLCRIQESLDLCGIADTANRLPSQISGGQQQRVALARAIAVRPRFLFLDEPFSGIDIATKARLMNEIDSLARLRQFSVVLVSHDLCEVIGLCETAVILEQGIVRTVGKTTALLESGTSEPFLTFNRIRNRGSLLNCQNEADVALLG